MLVASVACLALASPSFTLIETIPSYVRENESFFRSNAVIGSPLANCFYLVREEHEGLRNPEPKTSRQLFRFQPGQSKFFMQEIERDVNVAGTNQNGQLIFQSLKTLQPEGDPGLKIFEKIIDAYNQVSRSPIYYDSGTEYFSANNGQIIVSGPRRETGGYTMPAIAKATRQSVAILPSNTNSISSDGNDHLITVTTVTVGGRQFHSLNLSEWGKLDELIPLKSLNIPQRDGNRIFKIASLAATSRGQCFIVIDTWLPANKLARSILFVDIETGHRQIVDTLPLDIVNTDWSDIPPFAPYCRLWTIDKGKFLALQGQKTIRIYRRNGS